MFKSLLSLTVAAVLTLLCACTISSPTQLANSNESVTPLPEQFVAYGYKQGEANSYARTREAPTRYIRSGNAYVASDNSMTLNFVPLDDHGYLLSVAGNGTGALYGTAWVKGQIVVIRMMLDDDADTILNKARMASPPDIASDISRGDSGLTITKRRTLDHLVDLMRKGTVPTQALVVWVSEDPDAPTPKRITRDADGWKAES
jgi:hypothetical protein